MNNLLTVEPSNGNGQPERVQQPEVLKTTARIISWIFHPVFIPVYVLLFLMREQPHLFAGLTALKKTFTIIQFGVMYIFFPVITALLLKALGFIDTIYMKTQKDRIIPYVICMIYYFWVWYVIKNQSVYPDELVKFSLAVFIVSVLGLMSNAYMKTSMHTMAMGVMAAFVLSLAWNETLESGIYISGALFLTGLVCTARLIVSTHTNKEIYTGLFLGITSLIAADILYGYF